MHWTPEKITDQSGKAFLVTGANTGLGYEAALELAKKYARVILTDRNEAKLLAARDKILAQFPAAQLEIGVLDLNRISSIKTFAEAFLKSGQKLDVLINNAGVMFPPPALTEDGLKPSSGEFHWLLCADRIAISSAKKISPCPRCYT